MLAWLLGLITDATAARAEDVSADSRFFQRLAAPMTSVVDGKPFREALEGIAEQAGLNLWLDRQVDPSIATAAGPVGPTVFEALEKLAATRNCVVMPVADVVLVGRDTWVDRTTARLFSLPRSSRSETARGDTIDVAWEELTTPIEALNRVLASTTSPSTGPFELPHDHWPAVRWHQIDRQVAAILIRAQFDPIRAQFNPSTAESGSHPEVSQSITRRYPRATVSPEEMLQAMKRADASSVCRGSGGWIVARGNASAHRAATATMLRQLGNAAGPDPDADTFTLKKMSTTAENALKQLAQAAGKTCIIEADAAEACKVILSIEGNDVTLRQLIQRVAQQAGVTATWEADRIVISLAP